MKGSDVTPQILG